MKTRILSLILILLAFITMSSMLCACSPGIKAVSTPALYWDENDAGTVETNDIARLQKQLPFTIVLPEYLPEDLKSQPLKLLMHKNPNNGVIYLDIEYFSPTEARQLLINENLSKIELPDGMFTKLHPGKTIIKIEEVEVLEEIGNTYVNRSTQKILVKMYSYNWILNKTSILCSAEGYDQVEARKIVESMKKQMVAQPNETKK